jgi:hypothetical protein
MLPLRQGQSAANTAEASTNELNFKRCECECVNVNTTDVTTACKKLHRRVTFSSHRTPMVGTT